MNYGRKKLYKIALVSTHGTGKTTLCYDVAAQLKKRGFKVKVFSEIASSAYERGIPINENTTLNAQMYIMMQHISEELIAGIRGYQIVVCDRSVFDNLVYMERRCGKNDFMRDFLKHYSEKFPYDVIYKLPIVGELQDDGVRDFKNEEFRLDIYNRINEMFKDLQIDHKELPLPTSQLRGEWADIIVQDAIEAFKPRQ